jgi:hypothetical protein
MPKTLAAALVTAALVLAPPRAEAAPSWDLLAGGVPGHDFILDVDLGFGSLPRVALSYGFLNRFSLGVSAAFDYSALTQMPSAVFTPSVAVGFPMRIEAYRSHKVSVGIKLEPGLALAFNGPARGGGTGFGMLIGTGLNVGVWVIDRLMVGGGIDAPIVLYFVPGPVTAYIPILFGPIMEFHANNLFALGLDLKLGPGIIASGPVQFAMRMIFTLGFHF